MKYLKQTIAYLFIYGRGKKALAFSLLALLPCAFIAYFLPFSNYAQYFSLFSPSVFGTYAKIWTGMMGISLYSCVGLICAMLLLSICIACYTSVITRNMRVGVFNVPSIFLSVNEYIIPGFFVVLLVALIILATHSAFAALYLLWVHLRNRILGLILSAVTFVGLAFLDVYMFSSINLWLPVMAFNGVYTPVSLSSAFYKSRSHQRSFVAAYGIPVLIMIAFSVGAYFTQKIWYVSWILSTIGYMLLIITVVPQSFIIYCDTESVPRADLSGYPYKWR